VQFVETLFGEVLAGVGKNQVVVADASLLFLPARIEDARS
jgi:hypothetical protein